MASFWKEMHVELVIFVVTLGFAIALRGLAATPTAKPAAVAKSVKSSKDVTSFSKEVAVCCDPRPPESTRYSFDGAGSRSLKRQIVIVNEIMEGARAQPTVRFSCRVLSLYDELREILRSNDIKFLTLMHASKHSPVAFYTVLVQCVMRVGKAHLVDTIISDMKYEGVGRTLVFYESAMKQLAGQKHYDLALGIYDHLVADGLEPSAVTCSCLISFAAEVGELNRAAAFFQKLSSVSTPSIRAYMTMLRVHGKRQDWHSAVALYRDMQKRGVKVDSLVLNIVLATGVAADQVLVVEELLAEADAAEPPISDAVSYNTLVKCYAQHNDFPAALAVIGRMRARGLTPNAITFNSVMDAAVRCHRSNEPWNLIKEMRKSGLEPDKFTCSILVKCVMQDPTVAHVHVCLQILREVDSFCDQTLKSTLYHCVIEAAAQAGDSQVLMHAFSQARQHNVVPSAAAYRRLREFAEACGITLGGAQ